MAGLFQIVKNGNHEGYGIKYCIVLTNAGVWKKVAMRRFGGLKEIFEFTITSACGSNSKSRYGTAFFLLGEKSYRRGDYSSFTYKLNGMPCGLIGSLGKRGVACRIVQGDVVEQLELLYAKMPFNLLYSHQETGIWLPLKEILQSKNGAET